MPHRNAGDGYAIPGKSGISAGVSSPFPLVPQSGDLGGCPAKHVPRLLPFPQTAVLERTEEDSLQLNGYDARVVISVPVMDGMR